MSDSESLVRAMAENQRLRGARGSSSRGARVGALEEADGLRPRVDDSRHARQRLRLVASDN